MVLFLTVYLHCFTCYWWQIIKGTEIWIPSIDQISSKDQYYSLYSKDFSQQYLYSLHSAVMNSLGSDTMPRDLYQTIVSGIGLFLGALINANIFGELSLIFSSLDIDEKEFQAKLSKMNTAMINLVLPFDTQQKVRDEQMRNQPTQRSQK